MPQNHAQKEDDFLKMADDSILLRRRPLYPTELRGLIQKIFNLTGLQDSNDSIFRRRTLYPAELRRQMIYYVILASQRVQVKKKQNKTDLFGAAFSLFGRA